MTNETWYEQYKELSEDGLSHRAIAAILNVPKSTLWDRVQAIKGGKVDITPKQGMRVLLFDLESAPTLAYVWQRWKQNIGSNQVEKEGTYMLTAAWKWLGEDFVHGAFAKDPVNGNDSNICALLYEAIENSDVIIGHNSNNFDLPILNARLVQNGFQPLKSVKKIDTLQIAKKNFKFNTNKLDDLGKYLGVGRKIDTGGFELWHKTIKGDNEAFCQMMDYNKQDVLLLERVYLKLRAFDSNPTANANHYHEDNLSRCPVCGSSDVQDTGNAVYTPVSKFAEMKCGDCGHRSRKRQTINDVEKRRNILITPK